MPPVIIQSGSSSFSCDLEPTVSNPTTMSSSSMVSTTIDNNDNDVEEEHSVVGSVIAGSSSLKEKNFFLHGVKHLLILKK